MMRFGPFSTRGGYDWTNLTIGDLIALNGIKETTETERVALHVNVARLETEDGAPVPLPPLPLRGAQRRRRPLSRGAARGVADGAE